MSIRTRTPPCSAIVGREISGWRRGPQVRNESVHEVSPDQLRSTGSRRHLHLKQPRPSTVSKDYRQPARTPLESALQVQYAAFMDENIATLASAIGVRVKQERLARRMTLDQLAETAGVSRRMLINVEQATMNPSVGTLLRISDALGVGLPDLVQSPEPKAVKVIRKGEGAVLWSSDAGGRGVLVGGTEPPEVVELWDWTLGPGDEHSSEAHTPGTKELLQVQEGTVTVRIADQTVVLEVGDSVTFPGDVAHSYTNNGSGAARFSLAVFERGVGSGHREANNG